MPDVERPRCHRCGREVEETKHTRSSYRVGYFELLCGEVEEVVRVRPDEEGGTFTFLRLIEPRMFYTCADCYRLHGISGE
jgi:hypothetical protein